MEAKISEIFNGFIAKKKTKKLFLSFFTCTKLRLRLINLVSFSNS